MQGGNHAALGAAGGMLAATYLEAPLATTVIMIGFGALGGLLPDTDTKTSALGRFMPYLWHKIEHGHRRFSHSLPYCLLIFVLALLVQYWGNQLGWWNMPPDPYIPCALTAGVLSHLFGDALTYRGVPWFYPFTRKRFTLLGKRFSFKTGSAREPAAVTLLLSIAIAVLLMPYTGRYADIVTIPPLLSFDTGKIVIFLATVLVSIIVLTAYRLGSPFGKRRH